MDIDLVEAGVDDEINLKLFSRRLAALHVNMPTLKLVRNLTYFNVMLQPNQKHFNVKAGVPGLSQPGVCQVAL